MKTVLLSLVTFFCTIILQHPVLCATIADIDPCALIAPKQIYASFPELKTMQKQSSGNANVCNFLDKYEIPALIISLTKAGKTSAEKSLSILGSGYSIKNVPDLGDDAAVSIQQANPKFGLKEGIAMLYVKKGTVSLTLSPVRVSSSSVRKELTKLKEIAAEMLNKL